MATKKEDIANASGTTPVGSPLIKLLLGRSQDIPGSPLFSSQADLAKAISELPNSSYRGKELSLRSYLNQVLKGWRRCSERLEVCVIEAVKNKIAGKSDRKDVEERIRQCVKQHNEIIVPGRQASDPDNVPVAAILDNITARQKTAESVFIINSTPRELTEGAHDSLAGLALQDLLLGKSYVYCLPNKTQAIMLWRSFLKELIELKGMDIDRADEKLKDLEQKGSLAVHVIPHSHCLHPTVVFDAETSRAEGWIWYVPYDPNKAVEWPKQVLLQWKTMVYDPIATGLFPGQERITWKDSREWIISSTRI